MSNYKIPVLFVDDEVDLLDIYTALFEELDFEVLTALSGEEAISIVNKRPDLKVIISDYHMEKMSGIDLLNALTVDKNKTIPNFYLLTGSIDKTDAEIKSMGGQGIVKKPFELNDIVARIKKEFE